MKQTRKLNTVASIPAGCSCKAVAELYQPSPIDDLLIIDGVDLDGELTNTHVNDVFLLFNQQRLSGLGIDTINSWLASLTPKNDDLAELRAKCSDEQLLSLVKSKYIQSPSELEAWSTYLNTHYDSEMAALAAIQKDNENTDENTDEAETDTSSPSAPVASEAKSE